MAVAIKQGDQYYIPILLKNGKTVITDNDVLVVEAILGGIRKTYPEQILFSDGAFQFPVTQQETFGLTDGTKHFEVRVKFNSGDVVGADADGVTVTLAESKTVL